MKHNELVEYLSNSNVKPPLLTTFWRWFCNQSTWNCRWKSRHELRNTFHTQRGWPYWYVMFPVFLFVISGFRLLFGWMLFLSESLSSGLDCEIFFLSKNTVVFIARTLLSQLTYVQLSQHFSTTGKSKRERCE